jgi:RNA polymerase sigma-70 factor (ECF subfamily)
MELDLRVRSLAEAGDIAAAATAAIESLGPGILGYLRNLHSDQDDAADVFQLWAENVWKGIPGFRGECALRAWAFRLAWHASARFWRDGWRQRRDRLHTSAASRLAASVVRSRPIWRRDERLEVLRKDLGAEDVTLLVLRLDRELPWNEIAEVLAEDGSEANAAALRKRFQRLKERLGELAREKGLIE